MLFACACLIHFYNARCCSRRHDRTPPVHLVFRCCISSSSAISSSNWQVSSGFAIHAVVHANRALKSLAPALRNWSPTCSDLLPSMPPKYLWQAITPHDLSPMSTKICEVYNQFCHIGRGYSTWPYIIPAIESTEWDLPAGLTRLQSPLHD